MNETITVKRITNPGEHPVQQAFRQIFFTEDPTFLKPWAVGSGEYPYVQWYGAYQGKTLVGFTRLYVYDVRRKDIMVMLSWTAASKAFEGKGHMGLLVKKAYTLFARFWKKKGYNMSSIWVETEVANAHAVGFYTNVFKEIGFVVQKDTLRSMWDTEDIVVIAGTLPKSRTTARAATARHSRQSIPR